jgi:hypothetical protein
MQESITATVQPREATSTSLVDSTPPIQGITRWWELWSNFSGIVELSWVYLTADGQSTSSSWYRAPLWGPWPDFILILSLVTLCCSSCRVPFLTRGRVCNLQCNRWLVRSLRTNNHTLPSHLRLCSLFVASYDSQRLRWRYSNPPPHRSLKTKCLLNHI